MYTFVVKDAITSATLNDGGVAWESGDKVGMYLEGYTGYANINTETTPNTAILYSPSIIPANSYAYAYYPYDSGNDDKTLNHILLPNVQDGGSASAMPLAGIPFKIESDVPAKDKPNGAIQFLNLGSVIDFRIYSSTYSTETVNYVTFTATSKKTLGGVATDLAVSGDGYLDLSAIDTHDDSTVDLTFGLGTDYDYAKVNNLSVGVADSKANATTPIYLVVAPGIYTGTITIGTDAATYTFDYSNKTLERNGIKKYNMNLDNASRVAGVVETVMPLPYSEPFSTGIGEFTTDGEQVASTDVWSYVSGYLKASAYIGGNRYPTTSWAYSPWIDLTSVSAAYVTFEHVYRYTNSRASHMTLWVMTDEGGADWEQLTIPAYSTGSDWTFVSSEEILLNSYVGHKVKLAFKYISGGTDNTDTGTWEIKNLHVAEKVYTTSFTWDSDDLEVEVGKTKSNHVTVNSGATITYDSDDTSIATVAADGTVTGVAEGTTTINVHVVANGNYPAKDDSFDVTVVPAVAYSDFTWDLSTDNTSSASESALNWAYRGVTMVAAKALSSTNANNYCPPDKTSTRFYANSTLTITPYAGSSIGYVEFVATTDGYATALKNSSWTNATASVDGTTVTVEPTTKTSAFSATIGATCGFTSVKVYYTGDLEPLVPHITVATNAATSTSSAEGTTATVNGTITLVDGALIGDVDEAGFYYKLTSAGSYSKVTCASVSSTSFSYDLTGLTKGSEYTFYAYAIYDGGSEVTGETATFTPTQSGGSGSYTITFSTGNGDGTAASTSTACSSIVSAGSAYLSGNLATATKVYYSGTSGLKLGTSSASGEIKMNLAAAVTPTSIVVRAKRYSSSKTATISLNGETAQSVTSDFDDYTFNITSSTSYLQLNASKYLWVESITVNY